MRSQSSRRALPPSSAPTPARAAPPAERSARAPAARTPVADLTLSLGASPVQLARLDSALVQLHAAVADANLQLYGDGAPVHAAAARGTRGSGGALPFAAQIQRSFGRHAIGHVQAYTGPEAAAASEAMGAEAFATGSKIAFGRAPSLHTAAHEAAHVVQQRAGVALAGGVGQRGDRYEQHADAVADRVVQGQSAEALLDTFAPGGSGGGGGVQRAAVQRDGPGAAPASEAPFGAPYVRSTIWNRRITSTQVQAIIDALAQARDAHAADTTNVPVALTLPAPFQPVQIGVEHLEELLALARHRLETLAATGGQEAAPPARADDPPEGPRSMAIPGVNMPVSVELAQTRTALQAQVTGIINQANLLLDRYGAWLRANWNVFNRATAGATGSLGMGHDDFVQAINDRLESAVSDAIESVGEGVLTALGLGAGGIPGMLLGQAASHGASALVSLVSGLVTTQPVSREDRAAARAREAVASATTASNGTIDREVGALRTEIAGQNTAYTNAIARLSDERRITSFRANLEAQERALASRAQRLATPDQSLGQRMVRAWVLANAGGANSARSGVDQTQWEAAQQHGLPGERGVEGHYEAFTHALRVALRGLGIGTAAADRLAAQVDETASRLRGQSTAAIAEGVRARFDRARIPLGDVPAREGQRAFVGFEDMTRWLEPTERAPVSVELRLRADGGAVVLQELRYWTTTQDYGQTRIGWSSQASGRAPTFPRAGVIDTLRGRD